MLRNRFYLPLLFVALDKARPEPNIYSHRVQYRCLHIDVTFRCTFASVSYCIRWCDVATTILPLLLLLLLLLHPFNGLFSRTIWVSRYQKGKVNLDLNEARGDGVSGCSGISWTICKQSEPRSRQITTPTPHHSMFTSRMLFMTTNQQCKSTEGRWCDVSRVEIVCICISYHSYQLDGCIIFLVLQR